MNCLVNISIENHASDLGFEKSSTKLSARLKSDIFLSDPQTDSERTV